MSEQEPVYFAEQVQGILWRKDDSLGLTIAPLEAPPDAEILVSGAVFLRYAIGLNRGALLMVPGYFETENGAIKTGRAAWNFLWAKFMLYPRADVIGMRGDGKRLHVLVRDLDVSEGARVLAYANEDATESLGVVTVLQAAPNAELPAYLAKYAESL